MLQPGNLASDFDLYATPDQCLKLSELNSKRVILAFYSADCNPFCDDQMTLYNQTLKFFKKHDAEMISIGIWMVKNFNTLSTQTLANSLFLNPSISIILNSDYVEAKSLIKNTITQIGFEPFDLGTLETVHLQGPNGTF